MDSKNVGESTMTIKQESNLAVANDIVSQETSALSTATPIVTSTIQLTQNASETTFMQPTLNSYHREDRHNISIEESNANGIIVDNVPPVGRSLTIEEDAQPATNDHQSGESSQDNNKSKGQSQNDVNNANLTETPGKKRKIKTAKKNTKLDTKSKLEKSRQSARECRARKKLRYQYLEDLVCNREKAVVKLREELSMFCEVSQRIDDGSLGERDRHSMIEQTKENSKT